MRSKILKAILIPAMIIVLLCGFTAVSYAKEKTVTLDFSGADLVYVIKLLAKEAGCDCVIESTVSGAVNMRLKDVPLSVALGIILKTAGYDYRKVDNLIVVAPSKDLPKIAGNLYSGGGADTYQVIMLENANCKQIMETLTAAAPGVSVKTDERINAIVVTGSLGAIKRVKDLVSKLDVPAVTAFSPEIQTKVFDLRYAKVEDVETQVKTLLGGLNYQIDKRTNSLVVRGTKQVFDKLQEYLNKTDIPLQQVALEVKVLSLERTNSSSMGPVFGDQATSSSVSTTIQEVFNKNFGSGTHGYVAPPDYLDLRFGSYFPFVRTPVSFKLAIDALISKSMAEVIANPTVTTLSGKEAKIVSSRQIRNVIYDSRTGTYTVDTTNVGITLNVTPSITEDNFLVVNVKPQLTDFLGFISNYPITNQRNAEMTVRIKDGEPIVIGGLHRKSQTKSTSKIPLLGDLPIFGSFFKGDSIKKVNSELIIIVTPRIISKAKV